MKLIQNSSYVQLERGRNPESVNFLSTAETNVVSLMFVKPIELDQLRNQLGCIYNGRIFVFHNQ